MPQVSDGNTDLISNLLTTSLDPKGQPLKWKLEKDNSGEGSAKLPDFTAEFTGDDGLKRIYSINMSNALGSISEQVIKPKDYDENVKKERQKAKEEALASDAKATAPRPVQLPAPGTTTAEESRKNSGSGSKGR